MIKKPVLPAGIRKLNSNILIAVLSGLFLLLVYGAGSIALPISILTQFQKGHCDSVLSRNKLYTSLYPRFVQDASLLSLVKECEVYTLAVLNEEKALWQESFDAYQVYLTTYPDGFHVKESHRHSAIVLMKIVDNQIELKQYEEALLNLNRITSSYSDVGISAEAWTLFPPVYISWGSRLRELGEFERAERVFNDFKSWSQTNQKVDSEASARGELAQTYLDWGLDLLSQKQFEIALEKFVLAVSADPQPQPEFAAEVSSGQRQTFVEWGNQLVELNEFQAAIEKFERAVALMDGNGDDATRDALIRGHIQWALNLTAAEDYQASLDQLDIAEDLPSTNTMKQNVETARAETYVSFSNSSGSQARRAIEAALESICKEGKKPELPIFGVNKDSSRVGWYGTDTRLPENMLAETPGELHYVVCVKEEKRIIATEVERLELPYVPLTQQPRIQLSRIQIFWHIDLRESDTSAAVESKIFEGGTPPAFPTAWESFGNGQYEGAPPDINLVTKWLEKVLASD